ncbi:MAG: hypothetical protein PHN53_09030 [Eubacteriales bacterium]|nr:hypothetical protein [Eubacteriales bacterium]MDD4744731.1 hypothetical protein [Eubacteriales bacterium]
MEKLRAADLLIETIRRDYRDDVAVVVIMGSTIYCDTHSRSDLDLYFVVNTPRGCDLAMTFIIDGIGYDYWAISWERLTRIANHEERITSMLTEGKVIYSGSDQDRQRFEDLKAHALDVSDRPAFVRKARVVFDRVYRLQFWQNQAQDLTRVRAYGMDLLFALTHALALLNRDTVKRGRGKLKGELLAMALLPDDFASLYDVLVSSCDSEAIKDAAHRLVCNTEALLDAQEKACVAPRSFREQLTGFYEELINFYNKIRHGCESGDLVTALYAAHEITREIEDVLRGTGVSAHTLPDLVGAFDPNDAEAFLTVAERHQAAFEALLADHEVPIRTFADFDELARYLEAKG